MNSAEKTQKKPTVEQIASLAGVSKATVSRVLNGSDLVKNDVARRVEAIISEVGYVKRRSSLEIPMTFNKITVFCDDSAFAPHTFYGTLLNQLKVEADKLSISLEMSVLNPTKNSQSLKNKLCDAQSILILGNPNQDLIEMTQNKSIPAVIINGVDPKMRTPSISPDYEFGAFMATEYLLSKGHRKIKFITANDRHSTYQRTDGFLRALSMAGIEHDPKQAVIDFVDYADRAEPLRGLKGKDLIRNPMGDFGAQEILPLIMAENRFDDCTAVLCLCDMVALSLLEALSHIGKRVPEDISVIGFDNLSVSAISSPPLTTMTTDYNRIAQSAIYKLITAISSPNKVATRSSVVFEMIERNSVRNL
ncbi:LacI family DNA-binding transcriptional regulator [Vibrio sp. E150_011]|uniref:LacI family DNA-binding transcriptional regulator n=1 Tax=unclassified Vibrio TaxID=2614977 RepID=UPI000C85C0FC|nr:LacI family DNA-binding transcriptional regulator [Vibrio sp. 10N.286.48.B7]PMH81373.1 hypothetical protein BCU58_21395 [Vibrio sp. 10N.286.48.B7]